MSKKKTIKEFAKELYIEYNSDGVKTYSLREISAQLLQKGYKPVTHQTVKRWAEKHGWNMLNLEIKQQSIQKAQNSKFTTEEQIIEAKSDSLSKDFKDADSLAEMGLNVILDAYNNPKTRKLISIRDALAAIKTGTEIKFRIADIPDSEKKKTVQIIKIGDQEIEF